MQPTARNQDDRTGFFPSLGQFVRTYRYALLAALAFAFVCFGFMLVHRSLTIDEETWIVNDDPLALRLWLVQGRFGLYLFDLLFQPLGRFVPILWDWIAVVLWQCAAVLFCHSVVRVSKGGSAISVFAFCAMFSSIPLAVGEVLSFSMFNLQQAFAMVLLACAVAAAYESLQSGSKRAAGLLLSAVLLFCATSFYQAFAVVFVTASVAYLVLLSIGSPQLRIRELAKPAGCLLAVAVVGVGFYWAVNGWITAHVAPGGAGYLRDHFVGWRSDTPAWLSFARAVKSMLRVWLGRGVVGGPALLLSTLVCAGYAVAVLLTKASWRFRVIRLVLVILLFLSPFAMNLVLATSLIVGRTLLALPLALAVVFYLLLNALPVESHFGRFAAMIAVSLVLCLNAVDMNRYFSASYQVYQQDAAFADQVMRRVEQQGIKVSDQPVVFIGKYEDGPAQPDWGPAVGSFFQWDGGNVLRMADFLRAQSYPVTRPSAQQIDMTVQRADSMANWPQDGCIEEYDGVLMIKLSEVVKGSSWYRINGLAP